MSKNSIIKGTLILTMAGLITRLLGFFYRIYLSNTLGTENLGIYQLIFPIYGICFTLYGSGIQTAISQLIAAEHGKYKLQEEKNQAMKKILKTGLLLSLAIAFVLSLLVYRNASFIATNIILEPKCATSLRVLAYAFPFCGVTACINGYYLGLKKAGVPAATQLLEQIVRVMCVYVIACYAGKGDQAVTCELAMFGVVIGEIASNLYNILSLVFQKNLKSKTLSKQPIFGKLIKLSLPLTGNRLIISILHSFEAILIPSMLQKSGLTNVEALSIYGILTGMAIPFILFPSTITNSLAVLLLPAISEAQAKENHTVIQTTASLSIKYSLLIGLLSTAVFILFGNALGLTIFHNQQAGTFLITLSWLCPFLYLTTTLGSIINGLGKTHYTLFNTVVGLSIRILFVLFFIPAKGISGYLIGMLISQLAIALLNYLSIKQCISISFNSIDWILKPGLILAFCGFLIMKVYNFLVSTGTLPTLLLLFLACILLTFCYTILLFITKVLSLHKA